ncbi:MAG: hypothetical protein O3B31_10025, partial [Chloroflexi bacterium]|nr:hypothetical protein [Chloroflexota bacterium]
MCFRRLDDVAPTEVVVRTRRLERVRAAIGAASDAAQRHPRLAIVTAIVLVIVGYAYLRYFRPTSPLPAASTAVAAVAGDDAWPTADGGAGLDRVTP